MMNRTVTNNRLNVVALTGVVSIQLLCAAPCIARADEPSAIPQIVDGELSIVFEDGVPSGTVLTTSDGPVNSTAAVRDNEGGLYIQPLNVDPKLLVAALESGKSIDITFKGQNSDAEWVIQPVIDFMTEPTPYLPAHFAGAADTTGTGLLVPSAGGARAEVSFSGHNNNYVEFPVDQPLPSDTIALGGIISDELDSPVGALLSLRVVDARHETFGYLCYGKGSDSTYSESTPLAAYAYRFGGPGTNPANAEPPTLPLNISGIVLEPDKFLWSGSMTADISVIYVIRQISCDMAPLQPQINAMVDRSVPANRSMSGFINAGASSGSFGLMSALMPKYWRYGSNDPADRLLLKALGIPMIVLLSDLWGYSHSNPPSRNWNVFEKRVKQFALDWRSYNAIWDIWNEPDNTDDQFAPSKDITDFYQIYNHAYHAIRSAGGPDVLVEGPSYARFSLDGLRRFLDYCVANNLEVNCLSWHELDKDDDLAKIEDDVAAVKELLAKYPQYGALRISKIQINETVGPSAQYRPGEIIATLYFLEQSGVDGACRACWPDSSGVSNCFNYSIDGLVDPVTDEPRSAYWAYKLYADGAESRIASTATDIRLAPIASFDGKTVRILIGNHSVRSWPADVDSPLLTITGLTGVRRLAGETALKISVSKLPDSGESELDAPILIDSMTTPILDGTAVVTLPPIAAHEALIVTASPG